ncbi:hypothetical protein FAIPA1_280053 [Frankia sp. AiPs1]|uniref:putative leader peptide n=1 Tax=Frankia sp. AiPa1 TaxID=573492 RepID=UPI0035A8B7DA
MIWNVDERRSAAKPHIRHRHLHAHPVPWNPKAACRPKAYLGLPPVRVFLTARRHIDLLRVSSAACR